MRKVILAASLREANAYCRDKGIRAVFAKSSAQVRQADHIIELPGFMKRRDRFTLGQARDSRVKYGKEVRYDLESDWVAPKPIVLELKLEADADEERLFAGVDLTDERTLIELKAELNAVGWTLKKLPAKKTQDGPVVDAPVEF